MSGRVLRIVDVILDPFLEPEMCIGDPVPDGTGCVQSPQNSSTGVQGQIGIGDRPSKRKEEIVYPVDLANIDPAAVGVLPHAIGAHENAIGAEDEHNRGAVRGLHQNKHHEKYEQPPYMRKGWTRAHSAEVDPHTGEIIVWSVFEDIDVSYDRVHWFHLLGDSCSSNSPRLKIKNPGP